MLEQLLLLALFLFVLFVNFFLAPWLRRRQSEMQEEVQSQVSPVRPRARVFPPPRAGAPSMSRTGPRGLSLPPVATPATTRRRARSRLGSLRDVRRGIILMTILGPCRALEPPPGPPR
jgi:hypothetical protein